MKIYARIESGVVVEIIVPVENNDGQQYPLPECYTADIVATCIDITSVTPQPQQNWTYRNGDFSPPSST